MELTKRQKTIYEFIAEYRNKRGYAPSRMDIAKGVGIHVSTLRSHLYQLDKLNLLTWDDRVPRSITLNDNTAAMTKF